MWLELFSQKVLCSFLCGVTTFSLCLVLWLPPTVQRYPVRLIGLLGVDVCVTVCGYLSLKGQPCDELGTLYPALAQCQPE